MALVKRTEIEIFIRDMPETFSTSTFLSFAQSDPSQFAKIVSDMRKCKKTSS